MAQIYVVGIGPGDQSGMTLEADRILRTVDVIAGYKTYTDLVRPWYPDKEYYENGMRQETERCRQCARFAAEGKTVALICSGDAGVYGMASLMLQEAPGADIAVIPGVTAATSGAAVLGAPLGHDFCVISLSDLLTPWEVIEKRLMAAAQGDFCIVLYNPGSRARKDSLYRACMILMKNLPADRLCGYVRNIGREGSEKHICTLSELAKTTPDMFMTVFIGNASTFRNADSLITPRGYGRKQDA